MGTFPINTSNNINVIPAAIYCFLFICYSLHDYPYITKPAAIYSITAG